jgi:uncharacterized peroxidase-related enzyme
MLKPLIIQEELAMTFISTISVDEAEGDVRKMYESHELSQGYVPNYAKLFSHRPEVFDGWVALNSSVRANFDLRRYELVTIAAAHGLRSTYCMVAHSNVLLNNNFPAEQLEAIAKDYHSADLAPAEVAIMAFAEKIARDASSVSPEDIQNLRTHGLNDTEIFDIASAAAMRCFFSKLLDALGAQADSIFMNLDDSLLENLTVGRAISSDELEHVKP